MQNSEAINDFNWIEVKFIVDSIMMGECMRNLLYCGIIWLGKTILRTIFQQVIDNRFSQLFYETMYQKRV